MSDLTLIPGRYAAVNTAADVAVNTNLGLYIGTGGNIVVVGRDGVSTTFKVFDAQYLVGRFATVRSAANGTTATGIVALYS